ncbi:MAG: ABC transporter ATP-binding protein [Lachnospiraceae bacterium]|nr:ABC transporter ATP-binding protein [Lachnospiraceae bacterium]
MAILEVKNLKKVYTTRFGSVKVQALSDVNFSVEEGEYVAIMGESGSGKTTLLNILASLDKATSGQVLLRGRNVTEIKNKELCAFRREHLGFVFQEFNLLDTLSLKDNIFLPMVLSGEDYGKMEERLAPLARRLSIDDVLEKYPYEVSGGQKQRAAACRAMITEPDIILADEPTGALDSRASGKLLKLFDEVNAEGQTILMVTHSIQAASYAGRVLFIKDGCVYHQIYRGNQSKDAMYKMISDALTVLQSEGSQSSGSNLVERQICSAG